MRRDDYKRLGEYIVPYLEKNVGLKVTLSQGINNNKYFQTPRQVAVDSENDQIVRTGQFAYNKATTRNGEKISIAYREGPDCTVSSAYQVFYIKDEEKLNPHYLLMWFKRPEFDRYARFKSFGSAHEFFTWEEMCNVYLPIPSIEEQRKIVAEYQAVEQRIENNNRLIKALEDTAQAIYHHTFVENIDPENLPEGWRMGKLSDICIIMYGKAHQGIPNGEIPIYGSGGLMRWGNKALYNEESVLVPRKGSLNNIMYVAHPFWTVDTMFFTKPKIKNSVKYLYYFLRQFDFLAMNTGSAVPSMTTTYLNQIDILIPPSEILDYFDNKLSVIHSNISSYQKENSVILKTKNLLLAKLS